MHLKNMQVCNDLPFAEPLKSHTGFLPCDFGLKKNTRILPIGTEGYSLKVQKYYNVHTTPYIALYDKNGKLVKAYEKAADG